MQLAAVIKELQIVCRWTQKFISYSFKIQSMVETFIQETRWQVSVFWCVTSFKVALDMSTQLTDGWRERLEDQVEKLSRVRLEKVPSFHIP